ncbi:MAG: GNAT family N-acetyltransferase [Sulfitobacter sp.]|nr:GNAT family N-acetyltransferase [Sulfitobacter sp.]
MLAMSRGRYEVSTARLPQDIEVAQALRARAFGLNAALDADSFDADQRHILVRDRDTGRLACCFRIGVFEGRAIKDSYAAQFYGLDSLALFDGKMMELGRFCVHPDVSDPDVVRIAWAAMTRFVDAVGIRLLFGCTFFKGTDPSGFLDAFGVLAERHLAPPAWHPRELAREVLRFADLAPADSDRKSATLQMPPLLRTYLLMGGWVSDHAVVDRQMNTLHVFTGLEIDAIPENRKRLLRGLV